MTDTERAIHNERQKLPATMLNTIGVALIGTGLIDPVLNALYTGTIPNPSF